MWTEQPDPLEAMVICNVPHSLIVPLKLYANTKASFSSFFAGCTASTAGKSRELVSPTITINPFL
jgi:hypothetical protein